MHTITSAVRLMVALVIAAMCGTIHARTWHVDQIHPSASDENPGTVEQPLNTISKAAAEARPGDTVQIAAGLYREHVSPVVGGSDPDNMITYQARPGDRVVIKGSNPWQPEWTKADVAAVSTVVWQAKLDPSLFTYDFPIENFNPFVLSPLKIFSKTVEDYYAPVRPGEPGKPLEVTRGMIFLAGQPLRQITDPAQFDYLSDVFLVSSDGQHVLMRLGADRSPQGLTFEIVTREQVFAPRELGKNFIRLSGLVLEHSANGMGVPQFGMVSTSRGHYWIIEDCTIRWAGTAGIDIGQIAWYTPPGRTDAPSPSTGKLDFDKIVRRCTISDNGVAGLWCYQGENMLIEDCVVERNNRLGRFHWEEAGVKCLDVSNSLFRNNLFRDNDAFGLWLDCTGPNNRVTGNLFIGNLQAGVFIERSPGVTLVDNNISLFTRPFTFYQMTQSDGFYNHHSSNVIFAHNLAYGNAGFGFRCLLWGGDDHSNPFHPYTVKVSHNRVLNNIAYANARGAVAMPVDQKYCWNNTSDYNLFWGAASAPLFQLQRGIVAPSRLIALVENGLKQHGIAPSEALLLDRWKDGSLGPNVGDMRHAGPLMGLPLWKALTGRDANSVVGTLPKVLVYADGRLALHLKPPDDPKGRSPGETEEVVGARPESYADLRDVKCTRLPYIKYDYFGKPRPADRPPTVGPIQGLPEMAGGDRPVEILLWPNVSPDRPPAIEAKISIERESIIGDWEQ